MTTLCAYTSHPPPPHTHILLFHTHTIQAVLERLQEAGVPSLEYTRNSGPTVRAAAAAAGVNLPAGQSREALPRNVGFEEAVLAAGIHPIFCPARKIKDSDDWSWAQGVAEKLPAAQRAPFHEALRVAREAGATAISMYNKWSNMVRPNKMREKQARLLS